MKVDRLDLPRFFNQARESVPAYRKFLETESQETVGFITGENWTSVPLTDKKSYLQKYPLSELFPHARIGTVGHASSGSSGKPTFWFRGPKQKAVGVTLYGRVVRDAFQLSEHERTLVIIAFSMGVWVAGTYTLIAFEKIAESNPSLSVFSPGIESNDICSIFSEVAPHFDNVVLIGYSGFLDIFFEQFEARGIRLPPKLFLITSGDKSTEEWRDRTVTRLKLSGPTSIINLYGSSDGGILGFESPLTIAIRRHARENAALRQALFADAHGALPGLFQFDPAFIDFEEINGELVFSADLDLPLLRYNIHDVGRVLTIKQMRALLPSLDSGIFAKWPFPFVTVAGRTDVAAVFFGLKIYPENILAGINDPAVRPLLSGTFIAFTDDSSEEATEQLNLILELAPGLGSLSEDQQRLVVEKICWHLVSSNIEYRKLCSTLDHRVTTPSFQFLRNGDFMRSNLENRPAHSMVLLWERGKKPRMIL